VLWVEGGKGEDRRVVGGERLIYIAHLGGRERREGRKGGQKGREGGQTRTANDVLGDGPVSARVDLIQHDKQQVETREEGIGQPDVFLHGAVFVVLAIDGVGRRQDRAPGIEGGVDAGLGGGRERGRGKEGGVRIESQFKIFWRLACPCTCPLFH